MIEGTPKNKIAFIILAGFSSTNLPILGLQKKLTDSGYTAVALPFWGQNKETDTHLVTAKMCHKNITQTIEELSDTHDIVIGIGVSLGGAFLMEHSKNFSDLDYIVSIGTPFKLRHQKVISFVINFYPIINFFWKIAQKMSKRTLHPIGALEMTRDYLENSFLKNLNKIKTPILMLQSKNDFVVDSKALEIYLPQIGSEQKKIIYIENTNHVIDYDNERILEATTNFIYFITEISKNSKILQEE